MTPKINLIAFMGQKVLLFAMNGYLIHLYFINGLSLIIIKILTIDRIDEHKDYSPDNCRWIPFKDNARFKSTTNYITATVTLSGRQWADLIPEHGTNYINKMIREQGKEKAIEYIEKRFSDKHNLYN